MNRDELRAEFEKWASGDPLRGGWSFRAYLAAAEPREKRIARLTEAANEFRDIVLNERYGIAESGMDGDQINCVLGAFDDTIGAALTDTPQPPPQAAPHTPDAAGDRARD